MDSQRPFLYLTLIFLGFLIWTTWQSDHAPKPEAAPVQQTTNTDGSSPSVAGSTVGDNTPAAVAMGNVPEQQSGDAQIIRVRTDVLDLQISTQGGYIVVADLPTYPVSLDEPNKPIRILDRNTKNYVAESGLKHVTAAGRDVTQLAPDGRAVYQVEKNDFQLTEGENELVVPMIWQGGDGIVVTKRFRLTRGSFKIDVEHEVQNNSQQPWSGVEYRQLRHGPDASEGGSWLMGVQGFIGGAYYFDDAYKKVSFEEMKEKFGNINDDEPTEEEVAARKTTGGWAAMLERYFVSAWIPPRNEDSEYYGLEHLEMGIRSYVLGMRGSIKQIATGATDTFRSSFWVGPKLQNDLEDIAEGLDLTIDYGMFAFISKPIFWLMDQIHRVVGNWGWTIIFLTIIIKLIFFWPSAASYKSMAKMKALAPKLKEITDRYSNDPQAKQKAMMDIYKKEKVNPLGGCLPILIQIPVFMGLYWVLLEAVELRQAPWLLWYKDLSIMDPTFILPLIMGASMFLQQKLNPPQMADPMQQKIFQFLPVMFTFMFLWFPAGLVLYWVVNNLLSIAQQWFINKKILGHA